MFRLRVKEHQAVIGNITSSELDEHMESDDGNCDGSFDSANLFGEMMPSQLRGSFEFPHQELNIAPSLGGFDNITRGNILFS